MSTFGEELRRERELRRISLRDVAEATKINLRYLEALESNQFGDLPGGVFNRGFVRAYSEFIGIDAEMMVHAYLHEESNLDLTPRDAGKSGQRGKTARAGKSGKTAGRRRPAPGRDATESPTAGKDTAEGRSRRPGPWIVVVVLVATLAIAAAIWWALGTPGWDSPTDPAATGTSLGSGASSDGR